MGIGPVPALRKLEEKHNLKLHDFGLIELNEAFAAQVLACDRELNFNRDKLNVNGGAIALGHPIGCTGTRITVTLLHEMLKRNTKRGVATLCVSGGLGMALALEKSASGDVSHFWLDPKLRFPVKWQSKSNDGELAQYTGRSATGQLFESARPASPRWIWAA
jgi:hypothetical protein